MSNENNNITTLDQILDKKYGEKGQPKREEWEQQFESFRLGVLLQAVLVSNPFWYELLQVKPQV